MKISTVRKFPAIRYSHTHTDNLISRVGLRDGMRVVDLTRRKGTVATLTETKITCSTPEKVWLGGYVCN